MPLIAMAHNIPYVATASVDRLHDLEAKVEKAMGMRGARYIQVFVPCPLGWGSSPADTIKIARLAVESGLYPLFEAEHGEITSVTKIRRQAAVADYLKLQRRFAHVTEERASAGPHPGHRRCQHPPLRPDPGPGGPTHEKQAIRHHAGRRQQPAEQDRLLAHRAPCLPGPPSRPATTPARPGRTFSSGSTWPRRVATRMPGGRSCRTIRFPPSWGASAISPARAPAIAGSSTSPWVSIPWNASSAIRP